MTTTNFTCSLLAVLLLNACVETASDPPTPTAVAPERAASAVSGSLSGTLTDDTPRGPSIEAPTAADLIEYTADIEGKGELKAMIVTNHGSIECALYEDDAPRTVANFVGLARGLHPWKEPTTGRAMEERPFYDGLRFHRVIKGFVIQAGDPAGDGRGGPGYLFESERNDREFDRAGVLAMANAGPDTNGSQFFITLAPSAHLQKQTFTIFGQCDPAVPQVIATVEVKTGVIPSERSEPSSPVVIQSVRFTRG